MTIEELKSVVDHAYENAPNARVEICFGKKTYEIARISQSGVVGWLYIEVGEVIFDEYARN